MARTRGPMQWLLPAAASAVLAVGGCNTSEQGATEPLVDRMIITIGEQEFTATQGQGGFGGQQAVVQLGSFSFAAEFRRADGQLDPVVNAADFEVRVAGNNVGSPLPTPITFERTGAFTGTITGLADGQDVDVHFSLFHVEEAHTDFGPYFLTVTRNDGGGGGGPPPQ